METWDTCFRWRENGRLRDASIEATWRRVADALAIADGKESASWARRYFDAQMQWHVLFDPAILARAGTTVVSWPSIPIAVLNVAAFMRRVSKTMAYFDSDAFGRQTQVVVRALDNVLLLNKHDQPPRILRIGIVGFADALSFLGKSYSAPDGRFFAGALAKNLAENALHASTQLARERGATVVPSIATASARLRGLADAVCIDSHHFGARHIALTAISTQPALASLANVTDAIDPPLAHGSAPDNIPSRREHPAGDSEPAGVEAQIAMRGVMQPFIDTLIDYPLSTGRTIGEYARERRQKCP